MPILVVSLSGYNKEFEKAGITDHDYRIGQFVYEVIVVSV